MKDLYSIVNETMANALVMVSAQELICSDSSTPMSYAIISNRINH